MEKILLPTSKLNRRSTREHIQEVINVCCQELQAEYDRSGKIGDRKPKDWDDAWWVAREVCTTDARRHAGSKVPRFERPKPVGG